MILDTEFLGNLQAGDETAREKAVDMEDADVPIRIPTAVVWEIYYWPSDGNALITVSTSGEVVLTGVTTAAAATEAFKLFVARVSELLTESDST